MIFNCTCFQNKLYSVIMKTVVQNCYPKYQENQFTGKEIVASTAASSSSFVKYWVQLQLILEVPKCSAGRHCVQTQGCNSSGGPHSCKAQRLTLSNKQEHEPWESHRPLPRAPRAPLLVRVRACSEL